ncbi:MAG: Fic family protein [Pirellulaceae bacterium]
MRVPPNPPKDVNLFENQEKLMKMLQSVESHLVGGRYMHWRKLRYHQPPAGLTHQQWWQGVKFRRSTQYKSVPLEDKVGGNFVYVNNDPIPEIIHKIDLGGGGHIAMPNEIANTDTRDQYYVSSLIEEAITSSQLEGATTTRPVAKEMIRTGRPPRDKSELMILNNYKAMKRIGQVKDKPLTKELVFELHRIVSEGTLDSPNAAGRFRTNDEDVSVQGDYGEVYHVPPSAFQLETRMSAMCDFANGETPEGFLHPILRAIILHFWLSYDHPFVDGNGRTARALFYWSMLRSGYWLCEFISISQIIRKAPIRYGRSFLYTETDDNDLTYFILHHLDVIQRAINALHEYIQRKTQELRRVESQLKGIEVLNHRQRSLISHALRHPNTKYTVQSHQTSHNVVYETARSDLMDLTKKGLLQGAKVGKTWYFVAQPGLEARLASLSVFPLDSNG